MVNLCLIVGSWGGGDGTGEYSKAKTHLINQKQATAEEMVKPFMQEDEGFYRGRGNVLALLPDAGREGETTKSWVLE